MITLETEPIPRQVKWSGGGLVAAEDQVRSPRALVGCRGGTSGPGDDCFTAISLGIGIDMHGHDAVWTHVGNASGGHCSG